MLQRKETERMQYKMWASSLDMKYFQRYILQNRKIDLSARTGVML